MDQLVCCTPTGAITEDTADLVYYAFDLLFLDGVDLRQSPLEQRKLLLY